MRYTISDVTAEQFAKRMFKLAWDASAVMGAGAFQDRGSGMTEEQVWENVVGAGDYPFRAKAPPTAPSRPRSVYGDYVFGRMMKLGVGIGDGFIEMGDAMYRGDYQSFARRYGTPAALVFAAAKSLGCSAEPAAQEAVR